MNFRAVPPLTLSEVANPLLRHVRQCCVVMPEVPDLLMFSYSFCITVSRRVASRRVTFAAKALPKGRMHRASTTTSRMIAFQGAYS
jgi:hypothetical protein